MVQLVLIQFQVLLQVEVVEALLVLEIHIQLLQQVDLGALVEDYQQLLVLMVCLVVHLDIMQVVVEVVIDEDQIALLELQEDQEEVTHQVVPPAHQLQEIPLQLIHLKENQEEITQELLQTDMVMVVAEQHKQEKMLLHQLMAEDTEEMAQDCQELLVLTALFVEV